MEDRIKKLIEEYIAGTLDDGQKKELLKLAETNQEIMQELNFEQHTMNIGEHLGRRELKMELNQIHDELFNKEIEIQSKPKSLAKPKWLGLILLIGVIVSSFFIFQKVATKPTPDVLIADYYQPFQLEVGERSSDENVFQSLIDDYQSGDYGAVVNQYNGLSINKESLSSDLLFSVAISNVEIKNFNEALTVFSTLDARSDFNIQDEVDWYKALTFLKMDDFQKLKSSLTLILEDKQHDYYQKANSLMKKI